MSSFVVSCYTSCLRAFIDSQDDQAAHRSYAHERDAAFPMPKNQVFFLSSRGNRLSATGLPNGFAEAHKPAGLDGGKPLRPHNLTHRFAVTRLGLRHQQRADVQASLPLLATYLGHASYSDTAYYLTGSADLLAIAPSAPSSTGVRHEQHLLTRTQSHRPGPSCH